MDIIGLAIVGTLTIFTVAALLLPTEDDTDVPHVTVRRGHIIHAPLARKARK